MCIAMYRKLANQGVTGIWAGFAESHPVGTYHVYNLKTRKMILTKDVIFSQKSHKGWSKVEKMVMVPTSYEGLDNDEELKMIHVINQNNNNNYTESKTDNEENLFDEDVNEEEEAAPKTTKMV